jgi:hypothetical protein
MAAPTKVLLQQMPEASATSKVGTTRLLVVYWGRNDVDDVTLRNSAHGRRRATCHYYCISHLTNNDSRCSLIFTVYIQR